MRTAARVSRIKTVALVIAGAILGLVLIAECGFLAVDWILHPRCARAG